MAKFKIEWSAEARLDLFDILNFYFERNQSTAYSKKLNIKINRSLRLIQQNPLIGLKSQVKDVKTLITGDYQLIYGISENTILIVMIWDCRRDPGEMIIDRRLIK